MAQGFLQMRNGYFWDPAAGEYFVPRGVAYQIWNPPVGANQSLAQVDYDLVEFKKLHANSVRCEMTWGQVEIGPDQYDWTRPDHLVRKAEELGLKLFVIIGYQYPPSWFPTNWHGINNQGLRADVIDCLAHSDPSNALSCLPPQTAAALQSNLPPAVLAQVLGCLVTGAQAGGVSNILACLQSTLTPEALALARPYLLSDVINYEDPEARAVYQKHIATLTARYKDSPAIGAWILGNEYAYFDLWEDPNLYPVHRFLGYDPLSQQSFRDYLRAIYQTNIGALNLNWQTNYADFDAVPMPLEYPPNRLLPGYQDLLQWRKQSIGNFIALGAVAARQADPNHLQTYSMVGGLFNGRDANYTCEDAKAIVAACATAGAPLDFWSINNYAWASLGSEMRSAAFGIAKYQEESGLPVMISETGHSSTEDLFDVDPVTGFSYSGARQPKALPSTLWESLLSGAIGVHFFTWNDRSQFTQGYFYRERGFGIVQENRQVKEPVYDNMVALFRQMENMRLDQLLGGSSNPPPDIHLYWSTNADMVWPRANQENAMIWGALRRLGYQPWILDDRAFARGDYTNAPALLLSRCFQMNPADLATIANVALPAGIAVHAQADLPGQYDAYDRANPNWAGWMNALFGISVVGATPALDAIVTNDFYSPLAVQGVATLGSITPGYQAAFTTWKIWEGVQPTTARTVLTDSGYLGARPGTAALLVKAGAGNGGKTAVNTFALGDTYPDNGPPATQWNTRSDLLGAIYRSHFGLQPVVDVTGTNAAYVLPEYRLCQNGSALLFLMNEYTNTATVTVSAPTLLAGRKVEDLIQGGVLTTNSTGTLGLALGGDEVALLYAYPSLDGQDRSLINPNPNKLWFTTAPPAVWPNGAPYPVGLGYDLRETNLLLRVGFERVGQAGQVFGLSAPVAITGLGTNLVNVPVPDADPNNPDYVSSPEGGDYVFHAWLEKDGQQFSDCRMPVRLLWGVHPLSPLLTALVPGQTCQVPLGWEELPSYVPGDPTPIDRAALWDSLEPRQHYRVALQLLSAGQVVGTSSLLTVEGTATNLFSMTVPANANGPFSWAATLSTAPNVLSHDVLDSFEGRERGAMYTSATNYLTNEVYTLPWSGYNYAFPNTNHVNLWQNEGVQLLGSDGSQSAFLVITNPPGQVYSGFGFAYVFPTNWALPSDTNQWRNYSFAFDFMEASGLACVMEMQVKSTNEQWIQFTQPYNPTNGWDTIHATLDQFASPSGPGLGGFDPHHVKTLVVNIRMEAGAVQYVGSFDNIRFQGPETDLGGGQPTALYRSADDSLGWLSIGSDGAEVIVSWLVPGTLQTAMDPQGPWTNLTSATSPYPVQPGTNRQFFRLTR